MIDILTLNLTNIDLFLETIRKVMDIHPFRLFAYVILPDHFHWLMKVDPPVDDFSKIMHSIKRNFTLNYKKTHDIITPLNIWQKRFWDHIIRNEQDLENHLDYIHWNPVKHGFVNKPEDWTNPTYRNWLNKGFYDVGWGWNNEPDNINKMDFE